MPYTSRPMALPLLVALYRDQKTNSAEGRKHRTPAQVMCGLLTLLMHWFPEKRFVFAGDSTYGSHEMARFAYRHRKRLTLVSKIVSDANFYEPPPKRIGKVCGRPRVKGAPLPSPEEVVSQAKKRKRIKVVGTVAGGEMSKSSQVPVTGSRAARDWFRLGGCLYATWTGRIATNTSSVLTRRCLTAKSLRCTAVAGT